MSSSGLCTRVHMCIQCTAKKKLFVFKGEEQMKKTPDINLAMLKHVNAGTYSVHKEYIASKNLQLYAVGSSFI